MLVTLVYFRVALIVLSLVSNDDETGYFGASFRVTEVLLSIPQLATASAFPIFVRAARDDADRLVYGVGRVFHAMIVLGAGLALVLALGATFVIDVIAGPDFAPAAGVLRIQAVTLFVVFLVVTFNYALLSLREHRMMLTIMGAALVLNAAGAWVLGASHGARGAALATMIVDVLLVVATGWALWRLDFPVGRWLRIVPRIVLALAPAAALWFAPVPDVVKALIGAVVYVGMLVLLRAVPEEVAVELRRARAQRPAER
jgi:O-antigen/teichoic acid export membrane protein